MRVAGVAGAHAVRRTRVESRKWMGFMESLSRKRELETGDLLLAMVDDEEQA